MAIYSLEAWYFDDALCRETLQEHFKVASLEGIGLSDYECGMIASGALLKYLEETQKNSLSHMSRLTRYATGNYMVLDSATRRNLELVETLREKQKRGSLLWVLDKTKTAMGARTLRKYVEQPLIDKEPLSKGWMQCGIEGQCYLQRRNPGIFESGVRSGASGRENHLSVSKSKRPDCFSEFPFHAPVGKMHIKGYGE